MNVLFLGAGKRVSMANIFKDNGFNIFSYETDEHVPISKVAKIIIGKRWKDNDIIDDIINIVNTNDISLVIPFQDAAIELCDSLKAKGINVVSSSEETAKICHNKKELENFMMKNFPEIYPYPEDGYDRVYKPVYGFGGRGIIKTDKHLHLEDYICQKMIEGTEYSVDCFSDISGKLVDAICRLRTEVCCGEVSKSKTVQNEILLSLVEHIGNKLNIIGPSNFQFIIDKNNKPYLIEINCRFGGGFTFSYKSGLDFITLIKNNYFNETNTYKREKKDFVLMRYYEDYVYEEQENSD